VKHPNLLGTNLLVLTKEYDKFDKSDKRVDILAVAEDKKLVVIELKRSVEHSHADLQAIRYAAFCSFVPR
jgi:RecB family endonuclease NucS